MLNLLTIGFSLLLVIVLSLLLVVEFIYYLFMIRIYKKHQKINNNLKYYEYDDFYAIHHTCNNFLNTITEEIFDKYKKLFPKKDMFKKLFHYTLLNDKKIIDLQKIKKHPDIISNPNYKKYVGLDYDFKSDINFDSYDSNIPYYYPFIVRLYNHYKFELYVSKLLRNNYQMILLKNGIYFVKNQNKESTICILTGTGGNLFNYTNILDKLSNYNVIICIYRGCANTFYIKPALLCNYVKEIIDQMIKINTSFILMGHSMGGHVIQHIYEYAEYNNIKLDIKKEILIESGCFLSTCFMTYISKYISIFDIYKILSSNSNYKIHNIIFSYILKSFDMQMMLSSTYIFRGCRFSQPSNKIISYIICTDDDPIFNLKNNILKDEIRIFSPDSIIISYPGYHGDAPNNLEDILKKTNLII